MKKKGETCHHPPHFTAECGMKKFILPLLWLPLSTTAFLLQSCAPDTLTLSARESTLFFLQSLSRTAVQSVKKALNNAAPVWFAARHKSSFKLDWFARLRDVLIIIFKASNSHTAPISYCHVPFNHMWKKKITVFRGDGGGDQTGEEALHHRSGESVRGVGHPVQLHSHGLCNR